MFVDSVFPRGRRIRKKIPREALCVSSISLFLFFFFKVFVGSGGDATLYKYIRKGKKESEAMIRIFERERGGAVKFPDRWT